MGYIPHTVVRLKNSSALAVFSLGVLNRCANLSDFENNCTLKTPSLVKFVTTWNQYLWVLNVVNLVKASDLVFLVYCPREFLGSAK